MDYSNSRLVVINTGTAKIQNGVFKLVHTIDLIQYENLIETLENGIDVRDNNNNSLLPYLSYSISQIKSCLSRLKSKTMKKRSLDFIGRAWKWLAGSPDHHDFEIIENKINNVLVNNNNQIVINQLTIEKVNQISKITNNISKLLESQDMQEKLLDFKYKLEIIKEELSNIEYAIHWAKSNIVNSFIFSNTEVNILRDIFYNDNIPFANMDELLNFSKVKVASNNNEIIYIVNIPTTNNENCDNLLIKPVRKNNKIIKTIFKNILSCNDKMFGIKNDCKNYNKISICEIDNILDISKSECIPNLLKSKPSRCTTTNDEHVALVEEIDDSMILLNEYKGQIEIDNSTINIDGTFIIHHLNSTVRVGNQTYLTNQVSLTKPLPALLQPSSSSIQEQVITLERMEAVNVNNTHIIDRLKIENKINLSINIGLLIIFIILGTIIYLTKRRKRNETPKNENNSPKSKPESSNSEQEIEILENTQLSTHSKSNLSLPLRGPNSKKIHDLPFF